MTKWVSGYRVQDTQTVHHRRHLNTLEVCTNTAVVGVWLLLNRQMISTS